MPINLHPLFYSGDQQADDAGGGQKKSDNDPIAAPTLKSRGSHDRTAGADTQDESHQHYRERLQGGAKNQS